MFTNSSVNIIDTPTNVPCLKQWKLLNPDNTWVLIVGLFGHINEFEIPLANDFWIPRFRDYRFRIKQGPLYIIKCVAITEIIQIERVSLEDNPATFHRIPDTNG